jgi:hypothetical protein
MDVTTKTANAALIGPDGSLIEKPSVAFTAEEAALLRRYKKFLAHHGLREALYCNDCWEGNRSDGLRAFVRDDQILFECRCKTRFHQGPTL